MQNEKIENRIHEVFEIGILLKGANAVIEIIFGIVLLFTMQIADTLTAFVENQLLDDPTDFFATHVDTITRYLTPQFQLFGALYLLSHGIVKIVLVWGLLKNRLWAYPASLAVLVLFIVYQVIKYMENHPIILAALTVFDIVIIWLIWHEYRAVLKKSQ